MSSDISSIMFYCFIIQWQNSIGFDGIKGIQAHYNYEIQIDYQTIIEPTFPGLIFCKLLPVIVLPSLFCKSQFMSLNLGALLVAVFVGIYNTNIDDRLNFDHSHMLFRGILVYLTFCWSMN